MAGGDCGWHGGGLHPAAPASARDARCAECEPPLAAEILRTARRFCPRLTRLTITDSLRLSPAFNAAIFSDDCALADRCALAELLAACPGIAHLDLCRVRLTADLVGTIGTLVGTNLVSLKLDPMDSALRSLPSASRPSCALGGLAARCPRLQRLELSFLEARCAPARALPRVRPRACAPARGIQPAHS